MADTAPATTAPPAVSNLAAVSAISSVVPPNPSGGVRTLETNHESSSSHSTSDSGKGDSIISLDDFGDVNEGTGTHEKSAKSGSDDTGTVNRETTTKQTKTLATQSRKVEGQEEVSQETESQEQEQTEQTDQEVKLELDLDEEAGTKKLQELKNQKNQQQQQQVQRDYSQFKPEHQELLKLLPNKAYDKIKSELLKFYQIEKDLTEAKGKLEKLGNGKLPDSYYDHENAYQLTSDYSALQNELTYDNFEERHWESQLLRIKRGQPWINLKGYNDKTGQPIFEQIENPIKVEEGQTPPVHVEAELQVQNNLNSIKGLKAQRLAKIGELQANYKKDYETSKQGLEGLKNQFFKAFLDETKLPPAVKADIQAAKTGFEKAVPTFKGNPLAELLVYSYAVMKLQQRQMFKMMNVLNQDASKREDLRKAGPGKTAFSASGSPQNGDKVIDEKYFED